MRESEIEKYLVERAEYLGGEVRKVKWIGRKNAPDRIVMIPHGVWRYWGQDLRPNTFWVELKAPGKKPTTTQLREHARMRRMGQTVVVIDSKDGVDALLSK